MVSIRLIIKDFTAQAKEAEPLSLEVLRVFT